MKYVILGYSVAAVNAITAIRESDKKSEITVVTDEGMIYSRPLISYLLAGKVTKAKMSFIDKDFEEVNDVKVVFNTSVKSIDFKTKKLITEKKEKIPYDKLLLCPGGAPIMIPIEGLTPQIKGVFTFTKIADTENLIKYLEKNALKEVVILGGGLIGMKAAEGLLARKIKFKIVELADRLLANTFDKEASKILEKKLADAGCEFLSEATIKKITSKAGKIEEVTLSNGKKLKTKLLIMAVGVRPKIDFLKESGLTLNRGIIVNEFMETNIKDVYAAGDAAEGLEFLSGANAVIAIWPTAAKQGKTAGYAMAGKQVPFDGSFAMNSVTIMDIPSISFGLTNPKDPADYQILTKVSGDKYKKIVIKDNKIHGVILVNGIDRAGIYKFLIQEKLDIRGFKQELLKDEFGFLFLPKEIRKHLVVGEGTEV